MKFIDGESLAQRIAAQGAQPEAQVPMWAQQILDALADFPDIMGHIDMLTVPLSEACRETGMTSVSVLDLSTETVESRDPALNFIGLAVAYYP
jgi:hypothetical protein